MLNIQELILGCQDRMVRILFKAQGSDIAAGAVHYVTFDPDHMKYPCSVWVGRIFQFNILGFSVKNAPFTLNRIGQLFKKCFRVVSNIIYFEVTLVISDTSVRCKQPSYNLYFLGKRMYDRKQLDEPISSAVHFYNFSEEAEDHLH